MSISADKNIISSKDVLVITGVSRATLNNYIKMSIIPGPIVQKTINNMKGIKKIGYFPQAVLERIEMVKRLKREGNSMEDIARRFKDLQITEKEDDLIKSETLPQDRIISRDDRFTKIYDKKLKLTLEDISFPAYLVNYQFEIEWINKEAENRVFKQSVSSIKDVESRNIFRLLFNWEFHCLVQNWKDLATFHIAFAKTNFSKTWISKLYKGISKREIRVLEEIYDRVSTFPKQGIKDTPIHLLMKDGTTEPYRVYSIFFREGILFVYAPAEILYR